MSGANSRTAMFASAPVHKAFFALALPSVLGKIVMLLYNLADTWFISSTGDADIVAGVALISPVFLTLIALGDIFGVGGSSLISRLMGKNQREDTQKISAFCFYGALGLGSVITVFLLLFREPLLILLGTDEATYSHAREYYTYIALGAPVILACNTPMNLLRTEGMAKASMLGSMTGSVTNIILDPIFIFGLRMGAAGAAIATVIGNMAALTVYVLFYRKAEWISVSAKHLRVHWEDIRLVSAVGIPAACTNLMNSFAMVMTNRFLVPFGNDVIAAWSIAGRCTMICTMLLVSFSFSSLPLIGYNYGQKNYARMKSILKFIYTFELCLAVCCAVVLSLFAPVMIAGFMEDAAIIAAGTQILRCQLLGIGFNAVILISTCVFQATGNGRATLLTILCRQGFIFVPVLLAASRMWGFTGVLFAQPLTDLLTTALVTALMWKNFRAKGIV